MIRRVWSLLLVVVLLCGCGKQPEPSVGIANPISASSLEAMEAEIGISPARFASLPELAVRRYNVDPVLFQLEFLYEGTAFTLRLSPGEGQGDLSGMYFSWTEELEGEGHQILLDSAGHGICLWDSEGFSWALAVEEGATSQILTKAYSLLME